MALTIDQFRQAARLDTQGEVALKPGADQLENRGTIGSKVVRFFRSIGEYLGICTRSPDAQERQASALYAFREALNQKFGEGLARQVTAHIEHQPLTGQVVNETIQRAETAENLETSARKAEISHNRFQNQQLTARMFPGEYIANPRTKEVQLRSNQHLESHITSGVIHRIQTEDAARQGFAGLCQEAGIKDVEQFSLLFNQYNNHEPGNAHTLYRQMLDGATVLHSGKSSNELTEQTVRQEAVDSLKALNKLESPEQVQQANTAYHQYVESIRSLLVDLPKGDVQKISEGLNRIADAKEIAMDRFKKNDVEGFSQLHSSAVGLALSKLSPDQKQLLFEQRERIENMFDGTSIDTGDSEHDNKLNHTAVTVGTMLTLFNQG